MTEPGPHDPQLVRPLGSVTLRRLNARRVVLDDDLADLPAQTFGERPRVVLLAAHAGGVLGPVIG